MCECQCSPNLLSQHSVDVALITVSIVAWEHLSVASCNSVRSLAVYTHCVVVYPPATKPSPQGTLCKL